LDLFIFHGDFTMAENIAEVARESGVNVDQAKKGLGALLHLIQSHLPADKFAKVTAAIPGAESMMAAAKEEGESSEGGLLGAVGAMAGKLFGQGGGAVAALGQFKQLGFTEEQLQQFLPRVLEFLKARLPADVMNKLSALIPAGAAKE
jgi:hypothetical protein